MRHPLLLILLLALAIRLLLWSQPLHQPANDEIEYIAVASDLLAGNGWQFYEAYHWLRAPLYPLFLAGSLWLTGGNPYLAALPNIVLSVANVGLIALLTRSLIPRTAPDAHRSLAIAPRLAALLAALLLTMGTFASLYMSETLFGFLLTAAFLLLIRWQHSAASQPRPYVLLILAGICYGLATLTRSLPLAFLPVVVLWLTVMPLSNRISQHVPFFAGWRRKGGTAALFVACVLLTIAPWTLRNCQVYGRCILVETGLSYNLWAFSEPRESMQTIFRTLEQIPNPADRADEATRRGLERLREDPAILLRKLYPNWTYLWRVKPIQDRFLQADYYADPPPALFLYALLFDDLLYVLILVLSVIGFTSRLTAAHGRWTIAHLSSPSALLGLWVLYVVSISMLTHGEARYRHFFFPVLIPYAAIGMLSSWYGIQRGLYGLRAKNGALIIGRGIVIAVLLHTVLTSYPWTWLQRGAGRSFYHLTGNIARALGDTPRAEAAYKQALRWQRTPDVWLALGDMRRDDLGDLPGAESVYRSAWRKEQLYIPASARVGDILRRQGKQEAARQAFIGSYVSEQHVLTWSWLHLKPPPATHIAVGDGLDFGYVGGMYPAERLQGTQTRWTGGYGLLRLAVPNTQPTLLRLRMAAPHPDTSRVPAQVCVVDSCQPVTLHPTWRVVTLLLPTPEPSDDTGGSSQVVEIHSPAFVAPDGRSLGVLIDWAEVYP